MTNSSVANATSDNSQERQTSQKTATPVQKPVPHQQSPQHFQEQGFALVEKPVFNARKMRSALKCAIEVTNGIFETGLAPWAMMNTDNHHKIQRVAQIHIANETLYKLVSSPRIGQLVAQITGAKRVKIWGSQLYYKPQKSGEGGVVGYHRDTEHMPFFAQGALTAWLPLNYFNDMSGALSFVSGSHKWPTDNPFSGAEKQAFKKQKQQLQDYYAQQHWQEQASVIRPGCLSLHHQDLLHGSPENQSSTPRWALGIGLLIDDYQLNSGCHDHGFARILSSDFYCPVIYQENTGT